MMAESTVIHLEHKDGRRVAASYGDFKKHRGDIFEGFKITGDADDLPFEEPKAAEAKADKK